MVRYSENRLAGQKTGTGRITVHGRLTCYNGTPSFRIWIVGTKRLLGIRQSGNEVPEMPKQLCTLLFSQTGDRDLFADFLVESLTPYKSGEMQTVRVLSASKIVVTEGSTIVLRRANL